MLYALTLGRNEKAIIQQASAQNQPVPDKIANAPELGLGLEFYYTAFNKLTSCRPTGLGVGPIPWIAISEYGARHHLDELDQEDLEFIIEKMDDAFLKHHSAKSERDKANNERAAKARKTRKR